jgi:hypothetical protein
MGSSTYWLDLYAQDKAFPMHEYERLMLANTNKLDKDLIGRFQSLSSSSSPSCPQCSQLVHTRAIGSHAAIGTILNRVKNNSHPGHMHIITSNNNLPIR